MLSLIAAVANNGVIGKNNSLIWNIPEDLKKFKEITSYNVIIMGRKTFESLETVLPNRFHVVLSRDENFTVNHKMVKVIHNIQDLREYIENDEENFVIGGGEVYKLLLPYTNKMYITRVYEEFEGDTKFPKYDRCDWEIIKADKAEYDSEIDYEFFQLARKKNYKITKKRVKF